MAASEQLSEIRSCATVLERTDEMSSNTSIEPPASGGAMR